jgi:peroxiredoxin
MSVALGSTCPPFELPATDGARYSLESFAQAKLLVLIVSCNHCPYVVAYEERIVALAREWEQKGVRFILINCNDTSRYPDDDMAHMKERAKERGFFFPYLRDDSQNVVRALGARFTPEAFVFDGARTLRYHGRIDDNHRDAHAATSRDLRNAIDALLAGKDPPITDTTPVGCSVKWR